MPADALDREGARLIAARRGGVVLGIGALKVIGPGQGEIKSMHTAEEARGQGIARAILRELMGMARADGLNQLSLETGGTAVFAAARALYAAEGFVDCPPFGDYVYDPFSVFMSRPL